MASLANLQEKTPLLTKDLIECLTDYAITRASINHQTVKELFGRLENMITAEEFDEIIFVALKGIKRQPNKNERAEWAEVIYLANQIQRQ